MSARVEFERQLARLNAVWADPDAPGAAAELQSTLAARSNLLVARAAEIVGELGLEQFLPALVAAFDRFLIDSVRRDPTCAAKIAIAEALNKLEFRDPDLFKRGVVHVQPEPVWGGREDTAARLRAICALGVARSDPPDTLFTLAALMADPEADARIGAARAIAYAIRPGGAALLWYKVLIGDVEPAVMYECCLSLIQLEPERGLAFVAAQVGAGDPQQAEPVILAMGASRMPAALPWLARVREEATEPLVRRAALSAIAMLRDETAFAFLLDLLADGPARDAAEARQVIAVFLDDERRRRKVERALRRRPDLPPLEFA